MIARRATKLSTVNFLNQRRFLKTITILLPLLVVLTTTFFVSWVRGETVVATIPIVTGLPNHIASGIVLDETTLAQVARVILPSSPAQIALNSVTNRVYVEEYRVPAVDVMDGSTYSVVARLPVSCAAGTYASRCNSAGIAVNHVTNKIYAAFTAPASICCTPPGYTTIFVIDGSTNIVTANVTYAYRLLVAPPAHI